MAPGPHDINHISSVNQIRRDVESSSIVSSGASSSSSSLISCFQWFKRSVGLSIPADADPRLASSYGIFHLGRFLSITGSVVLLVGFCLKFFMLDIRGAGEILSYLVISAGLISLILGALLVLYSALVKAKKATKEYLINQEKLRNGGANYSTASNFRPESALSSNSFASTSAIVSSHPHRNSKSSKKSAKTNSSKSHR